MNKQALSGTIAGGSRRLAVSGFGKQGLSGSVSSAGALSSVLSDGNGVCGSVSRNGEISADITKTGSVEAEIKMGTVYGEDSGYYIPSVDDEGNLTWQASKLGMPEIEDVNIKGDPGYTPQKNVDYFDGKDGQPGRDGVDGKDGQPGKDGYTPQFGIDYFNGKDGKDGYTPVKGIDYFDGEKGDPGKDGKPGADGYTPVKGIDYFDGLPGKDGKDGYTPVKGVDYFDGEKGDPGYTPIKGVDYFDGQPGADGKDGSPGADGYTPQRGKDYWTDADKAEMIAALNRNFADYVIEAGVTGGWNWEKWNSGKYICWGTFRDTRTHYTMVNGFYGYYSSDFKYPIIFPTAPIIHFNCKVGSGFAAPAGDVAMSTVQARCYALSTASGEVSCVWEMYVVGRWK